MAHFKIAASWSGGKDSCLACYKAMKRGYKIGYLFSFVENKRSCYHGTQQKLIKLQADLIGIPLFGKEVNHHDGWLFEQGLKEGISHLKERKVKGMVFGDICGVVPNFANGAQQEWLERICNELEIKAIEPLWQRAPEKIIEEFIDSGFRAVVIRTRAELLGKDFIGREIDRQFLKEIKKRKICPCGENGEFHTFVVDGPMFKKGRIEITKSRTVFRKKGLWPHWDLDIQEWRVKSKFSQINKKQCLNT